MPSTVDVERGSEVIDSLQYTQCAILDALHPKVKAMLVRQVLLVSKVRNPCGLAFQNPSFQRDHLHLVVRHRWIVPSIARTSRVPNLRENRRHHRLHMRDLFDESSII